MASGKMLAAITLGLLAAGAAQAGVSIKPVTYKQDKAPLEGYLVRDSLAKGPQPGILLVGDWMGISDFAMRQAEKTAKLGYVVFVADIYGKGVYAKDQQDAAALSGIYKSNRKLMRARAQAGLAQLLKSPDVIPGKIAAMGYCFGGGVVLELARSGADLKGVAAFHGNLDTPHPEDAKHIKARIAVFHGADDPFVPPDQVQGFVKEMRDAGVDYRLTMYGGAVHAFTITEAGSDNSKGAAYNAKAAARSWEAMQMFYWEIFSSAK